jgi:hypothetical protein
MLKSSVHPQDLPLFSEDIELLSQVLSQICDDSGNAPRTPEADRIGAAIIQLYKQGVKDSGKLTILAKTYL